MDKRTVIGILLIAAILFLMPYYNKIINPPIDDVPQPIEQEIVDTASYAEDHSEDEPALEAIPQYEEFQQVSEDDSLAPVADVKDIEIITNDLHIVMSTKGADIKSILLSEFKYSDGYPIQMVPQDLEIPNFEAVFSVGGQTFSSNSVVFEADKDRLVLDDTDTVGAITFIGTLPNGAHIRRRMEFYSDGFAFRHRLLVENTEDIFDQYRVWWRRGVLPTEENASAELSMFRLTYKMGDKVENEKFRRDRTVEFAESGVTDFVSTQSKYFIVILATEREAADGVDCEALFRPLEYQGKDLQVPAVGIALRYLNTDRVIRSDNLIIAAPADYVLLGGYGYEDAVDLGWRWIRPITKIILWFFDWMYDFIPNYGYVILIFTLLMKLILLPLSTKQIKSMQAMQKLQPMLKELQEQYRDSPEKLNKATMALYKKHNVNPLGGCFPMLIQMPIFFALYRALSLGFQFRQANFAFWLTDLSSPDPYYVLPIIMAVTMFIQQKMTMKDPKQKMMVYIMPIFFLFIFRNMPSGLVLYWTFFNILTVIHSAVAKPHSQPDLDEA